MRGLISLRLTDAQQQAFSFLQHQATIVEAQAIRIAYPDIQYPGLIPIETAGDPWAKSVTFYSIDSFGRADWLSHEADDIPLADITREQFESGFSMAAIGYRYTLEELQQAMRVNLALSSERAAAARRIYEEFMEEVALRGNTRKNWKGLINQGSPVVATDAPADGDQNGGTDSPYWAHKTETQVLRDFNAVITAMWTASLTVELADTVLLPHEALLWLTQTPMPNLAISLMDWIMKANIYTQQTSRPLTVRGVRGLENAGNAGTGRLVAYRKDPNVLRLWLPMPHNFLPASPVASGLAFVVPGIFRTGGVEVRRPGAIRYLDKITAAP